jgi:hypothetical protein
MIGRALGVVTRIKQACAPGLIRIWCGCHQLDLVMEQTDNLHADDLCSVTGSVGKLFVAAADGILRILCERDASNKATDELPPLLPHELCRIDNRQVVKLLQSQRDRLLPFLATMISKTSARISPSSWEHFEKNQV